MLKPAPGLPVTCTGRGAGNKACSHAYLTATQSKSSLDGIVGHGRLTHCRTRDSRADPPCRPGVNCTCTRSAPASAAFNVTIRLAQVRGVGSPPWRAPPPRRRNRRAATARPGADSRTAPVVGNRDRRHARRRLPIDTQDLTRRATPRRRRPASPGCGCAAPQSAVPSSTTSAPARVSPFPSTRLGTGPDIGGDGPVGATGATRVGPVRATPPGLRRVQTRRGL